MVAARAEDDAEAEDDVVVDSGEGEEGAGRWKTTPSVPLERTSRAVWGWEAGSGGISTVVVGWLVDVEVSLMNAAMAFASVRTVDGRTHHRELVLPVHLAEPQRGQPAAAVRRRGGGGCVTGSGNEGQGRRGRSRPRAGEGEQAVLLPVRW